MRQIHDAIFVQAEVHRAAPILRRGGGNDVVFAVVLLFHESDHEIRGGAQKGIDPFQKLLVECVEVLPPEALHGPGRLADFVTPGRRRVRHHLAGHRVGGVREESAGHAEFLPARSSGPWAAGFRPVPRREDSGPRGCWKRLPRRPAGCCSSCGSRRARRCRSCRSSSCRTGPAPPCPPAGSRPENTGCGTRSSPVPGPRTRPPSATRNPSSLFPFPAEVASRGFAPGAPPRSWQRRRCPRGREA